MSVYCRNAYHAYPKFLRVCSAGRLQCNAGRLQCNAGRLQCSAGRLQCNAESRPALHCRLQCSAGRLQCSAGRLQFKPRRNTGAALYVLHFQITMNSWNTCDRSQIKHRGRSAPCIGSVYRRTSKRDLLVITRTDWITLWTGKDFTWINKCLDGITHASWIRHPAQQTERRNDYEISMEWIVNKKYTSANWVYLYGRKCNMRVEVVH